MSDNWIVDASSDNKTLGVWAHQQQGALVSKKLRDTQKPTQEKGNYKQTAQNVKLAFGNVVDKLKKAGDTMSTDDLRLVKETCISMKDTAKKETGGWFWNLRNYSLVKQLKQIESMVDDQTSKKPITVAQFNIGMTVSDFETGLATKHKEIRDYKKAMTEPKFREDTGLGIRPKELLDCMLKRAQLYKGKVTEQHIDEALSRMAKDNRALAREWGKKPQDKDEIRNELIAIFSDDPSKNSLAQRFVDGSEEVSQEKLGWLTDTIGRSFLEKTVEIALEGKRDASEREAAKRFMQKENRPEVFFLQETVGKNRPFVQELEKNGYRFIASRDDAIDGAIMIDTKRFRIENVHQPSDANESSPLVVAYDKLTEKRCLFASAHMIGIPYDVANEAQKKEQAMAGDTQSQEIVQRVKKIEAQQQADGKPIHAKIIGADMNVDKEVWAPRYDIFKKGGFQISRADGATNVNYRDTKSQTRNVNAIFFGTVGQKPKRGTDKAEIVKDVDFGDVSDHRPTTKRYRLIA